MSNIPQVGDHQVVLALRALEKESSTSVAPVLVDHSASIQSLQSDVEDLTTDLTAVVSSQMVVVNHGAVASTPRPTGAPAVYWIGTVEPVNAANYDMWMDVT